ncbi:MAG: hypothetical protein R6W75_08125 [Smithellaceae bacterium]
MNAYQRVLDVGSVHETSHKIDLLSAGSGLTLVFIDDAVGFFQNGEFGMVYFPRFTSWGVADGPLAERAIF